MDALEAHKREVKPQEDLREHQERVIAGKGNGDGSEFLKTE